MVGCEVVYLHAQVGGKLSQVLLGNHYFGVFFQHFCRILGQRVEVAEVGKRYLFAGFYHFVHSRIQVPVGASETNNQQVGVIGASLYLDIGNGYLGYFLGAQVAHQVVVFGVGGDGTRPTVFF